MCEGQSARAIKANFAIIQEKYEIRVPYWGPKSLSFHIVTKA